jgi:hypothetical protein
MTTEERLEALEQGLARTKKRTQWLLAGSILVLAGSIVLCGKAAGTSEAQAQPARGTPKEIRANEFIVVDENGKTRARLGASKDGTVLVMYDENSTGRTWLGAGKNKDDKPGLFLCDDNGAVRAALAVPKEGPGLALSDKDGTVRAWLAADKDSTGLALCDKNGKLRAWLTPDKDNARLGLLSENGKAIWQAP